MPTYTYEKDGKQIERDFPIGEAPDEVDGYKRVFSMPPVHYKGQGWTTRE